MLRRSFLGTSSAAALRRCAASSSSLTVTSSFSALRFNSSTDSTNSKESELEREAKARQDIINKFGMSGNTSTSSSTAAGSSSGSTVTQGGAPNNAFFSPWANTPNHRAGRLFSTLIIAIAGYIMMKRIGIFGDYSHLSVPHFVSPSDSAKWIIFMFNVDEARRRHLQTAYEHQRNSLPNYMGFFDFVDQNEPHWRSSPNQNADLVLNTVSKMVAESGAPRAFTTVKATMSGPNPMGMFTANLNSPEERAKRVDNMMQGIQLVGGTGGGSSGFFGSLFGGGGASSAPSLPADIISPQNQQQQQQQQQQSPAGWQQPMHMQATPAYYQQGHYPPQMQQQQQQYYGGYPQQGQQPQQGYYYGGYPQQQQQQYQQYQQQLPPGAHGSSPFQQQQQQQEQPPAACGEAPKQQ